VGCPAHIGQAFAIAAINSNSIKTIVDRSHVTFGFFAKNLNQFGRDLPAGLEMSGNLCEVECFVIGRHGIVLLTVIWTRIFPGTSEVIFVLRAFQVFSLWRRNASEMPLAKMHFKEARKLHEIRISGRMTAKSSTRIRIFYYRLKLAGWLTFVSGCVLA
jgi:hypothetical protein